MGYMMHRWNIWEDHGDPSVDARWREVLSRNRPIQRHASLGGAIPPEDTLYVPAEMTDHGRIPESLIICNAILAASPS